MKSGKILHFCRIISHSYIFVRDNYLPETRMFISDTGMTLLVSALWFLFLLRQFKNEFVACIWSYNQTYMGIYSLVGFYLMSKVCN
jgi:hypothetical protein